MKVTKPDPTLYDLKFEWQKTLVSQINRIMEAFTQGDPATKFERIYMGVMALDSLLQYYQNAEFKAKIKGAEDWARQQLQEMKDMGELTPAAVKNLDFLRSKYKLDQLISLALKTLGPDIPTGASEIGGVEYKGVIADDGDDTAEDEEF